jgi:helicase
LELVATLRRAGNWLSFAGRDARALHALFTDSFGGGTTLLLDDQATVAEIGSRFDALSACDPEDVVVTEPTIRIRSIA